MIGVLSDTHDNIEATRKAVKLFNELEVEHVLHAGDVVSPFMVRVFKELECPLFLVFGNNDGDRITLKNFFEKEGFCVKGDFGVVEDVAFLHGTSLSLVEALARSGMYGCVVYGHTHEP